MMNNIISYDKHMYAKEIVNPIFGPTKLSILHFYYHHHYCYYYDDGHDMYMDHSIGASYNRITAYCFEL